MERQTFSANEIALIKKTLIPKAGEDDLALFVKQCERTGLDPFSRQIYMISRYDSKKKKDVYTIQVSIDGFRLVAERSHEYQGQDGPFWCGDDGEWKDVWLSDKPPYACKVGVYRKDFQAALYGVARFDSYSQTYKGKDNKISLSMMWKKMPDLMIAKVAEALALRKAFPMDLSGLYTSDEMSQVEPPPPVEEKKPKKSNEDVEYENLMGSIKGLIKQKAFTNEQVKKITGVETFKNLDVAAVSDAFAALTNYIIKEEGKK